MRLIYTELHPSRIYNRLAVENLTCWGRMPEWHSTWWEVETMAKRLTFATIWRTEFDKTMNHFSGLRESMAKVGMLSPVSLVGGPPRDKLLTAPLNSKSGHYPPGYQHEPNLGQLLMTQPFGGSRITVADELGFQKIPCIVYDYSNLFPDAPEVTRANYKNWFKGQYIFTGSLPYVRDGAMNNQHRKAQRNAHVVAREAMLNV